jgi:hypothetical protein
MNKIALLLTLAAALAIGIRTDHCLRRHHPHAVAVSPFALVAATPTFPPEPPCYCDDCGCGFWACFNGECEDCCSQDVRTKGKR